MRKAAIVGSTFQCAPDAAFAFDSMIASAFQKLAKLKPQSRTTLEALGCEYTGGSLKALKKTLRGCDALPSDQYGIAVCVSLLTIGALSAGDLGAARAHLKFQIEMAGAVGLQDVHSYIHLVMLRRCDVRLALETGARPMVPCLVKSSSKSRKEWPLRDIGSLFRFSAPGGVCYSGPNAEVTQCHAIDDEQPAGFDISQERSEILESLSPAYSASCFVTLCQAWHAGIVSPAVHQLVVECADCLGFSTNVVDESQIELKTFIAANSYWLAMLHRLATHYDQLQQPPGEANQDLYIPQLPLDGLTVLGLEVLLAVRLGTFISDAVPVIATRLRKGLETPCWEIHGSLGKRLHAWLSQTCLLAAEYSSSSFKPLQGLSDLDRRSWSCSGAEYVSARTTSDKERAALDQDNLGSEQLAYAMALTC